MPPWLNMNEYSHLTPQQALLTRVLAGSVPVLEDIETLLMNRVEEDLHLDYKSKRILTKDSGKAEVGSPVDFQGKLRRHVAGFANGDGGVLIIGVEERPTRPNPNTGKTERDPAGRREVDAIDSRDISREALLTQVRDALEKLRLSLQPPPRVHVIYAGSIDGHEQLLLLIAVPRSDVRVFCLEKQQRVYYIRLLDSTPFAPAYLVEDLVLGRRRTPSFNLTLKVEARVDVVGGSSVQLNLNTELRNTGLVWIDEPRVGVVGFGTGKNWHEDATSLLPYLEVIGRGKPGVSAHIMHTLDKRDSVPPYGSASGASRSPVDFRLQLLTEQTVWAGALYVVSRGNAPVWYQVVVFLDREEPKPRHWLFQLGDRRPIVALHAGGFNRSWGQLLEWLEFVDLDNGGWTLRLRDSGP